MNDLIGIAELEQALGFHRRTIYRALHGNPPLPHYRLTRTSHLRFRLSEVQAFMEHGGQALPRRKRKHRIPQSVLDDLKGFGIDLS